jgi:diketogulonate reductase-like aldo/keto reductase
MLFLFTFYHTYWQHKMTQIGMPMIGMGTYKIDNPYEIITNGLRLGYKHIDTAHLYKTETHVSEAIIDSGKTDIFVTTKIAVKDIAHGKIKTALLRCTNKLKLKKIDLVLLHGPVEDKLQSAWKELENNMDEFGIRHIGVSNYKISDLEKTLETANIMPTVNQFEVSPFCTRKRLREYCKNQNIHIVGHSSLTRGERLDDQRLVDIGHSVDMTPDQVLLKWNLHHGHSVIPSANSVELLQKNINLPSECIDTEYMDVLDNDMDDGFLIHARFHD